MAGTASVDAILADAVSKLDALNKRMDALEVGEKHIIKGDDDDDDDKKDDAAKKDAAKSKADDDDDDDKKDDAITTPKNKILDSAKGASKADAGSPPLKDDDGELEIKHGKDDSAKKADAKKADSKKADAKKADAKKADDDDDDKEKCDDDDDDKKDDSVKADDISSLRRQISDQSALIAQLQAMMKPRSDDEHAAFADAQARADAIYCGFGKRAPRPLEGEDLLAYRKRLATALKAHSPRWKSVKFARLDDETFSPIEAQVYDDATVAAANPIDLEAGELRMVTKVDPTTNQRTNVFYGKESFVKQMGRPGRRVAAFRTLQSV